MNPQNIKPSDHFTGNLNLRTKISRLLSMKNNNILIDRLKSIHDVDRIAIFPSVSYGMAIVAKNLHRIPNIATKKTILIIHEEFPNDYYSFERVAHELNLNIKSVNYQEGEIDEDEPSSI